MSPSFLQHYLSILYLSTMKSSPIAAAAGVLLGVAFAAPVNQENTTTTWRDVYPLPTVKPDPTKRLSILPIIFPTDTDTATPLPTSEVGIWPDPPFKTQSAEVSTVVVVPTETDSTTTLPTGEVTHQSDPPLKTQSAEVSI